MSESRATSTAWTEETARRYLANSATSRGERPDERSGAFLLALTVVRQDRPATEQILDVASGPGGFLRAALDAFPEAHGIWFDFSEAMREQAMGNLASYGSRVRYELGDFSEVGAASPAGSLDLVLSAAASHHLSGEDLRRFYDAVAELLAPGGWCANLDIMAAPGDWDRRLRAARTELRGRNGAVVTESHPHPNPFPSLEDHLGAMAAAGLEAPQEIWRSAVTSLVLARRAGAEPRREID